jgi:hypothetical protein
VRVNEIALTKEQEPEYGGWKRLGYALGHLGRTVAANEREGYFNVGLLGRVPSMPGMVAGLQHSGKTDAPIRIGMLWLDAHPDFNTPETTRSGSLGWNACRGGHWTMPDWYAPGRKPESAAGG